jgi:hypothetical protein
MPHVQVSCVGVLTRCMMRVYRFSSTHHEQINCVCGQLVSLVVQAVCTAGALHAKRSSYRQR